MNKNCTLDTRIKLEYVGRNMSGKLRYFVSFKHEVDGVFRTFKGQVEED